MLEVIFTIPKSQLSYSLDSEITKAEEFGTKFVYNQIGENGTRVMLSALVSSSFLYDKDGNTTDKLSDVDYIESYFFSEHTLGVFNDNGLQYGLKAVVDEDGNEIVEGEAIYPFNSAEYVSYLPNIVEYDENGDVVNDIARTEPENINMWAGRKERIF